MTMVLEQVGNSSGVPQNFGGISPGASGNFPVQMVPSPGASGNFPVDQPGAHLAQQMAFLRPGVQAAPLGQVFSYGMPSPGQAAPMVQQMQQGQMMGHRDIGVDMQAYMQQQAQMMSQPMVQESMASSSNFPGNPRSGSKSPRIPSPRVASTSPRAASLSPRAPMAAIPQAAPALIGISQPGGLNGTSPRSPSPRSLSPGSGRGPAGARLGAAVQNVSRVLSPGPRGASPRSVSPPMGGLRRYGSSFGPPPRR